jgi:hypothetical protein
MKNTQTLAGQPCPPARIRARKSFAVALLLCAAVITPSAFAGDPCKTVLCMFGKFTGNSGGSECTAAEADYFAIIVKKKHGIDWNATASARGQFLNSCPTADRGITQKINGMFGKS